MAQPHAALAGLAGVRAVGQSIVTHAGHGLQKECVGEGRGKGAEGGGGEVGGGGQKSGGSGRGIRGGRGMGRRGGRGGGRG